MTSMESAVEYAEYLRGKFGDKPDYSLTSITSPGGTILRESWTEASRHARGGIKTEARVRWHAITDGGVRLGLFASKASAASALNDKDQ